MIPSLPQIILVIVMALAFLHFLGAGARTFVLPEDPDEGGSGLGQLSFFSGTLVALFAGVITGWSSTMASRPQPSCCAHWLSMSGPATPSKAADFMSAISDGVPDEVCDSGPYAFIRHPIYTSYMLAFLALLIALPTIATAITLVCNVALFVHMARSDERTLATSALAESYAEYTKRVRKFFPRLLHLRTKTSRM